MTNLELSYNNFVNLVPDTNPNDGSDLPPDGGDLPADLNCSSGYSLYCKVIVDL